MRGSDPPAPAASPASPCSVAPAPGAGSPASGTQNAPPPGPWQSAPSGLPQEQRNKRDLELVLAHAAFHTIRVL